MAISTYVLVGFLRTDRRSNEAALKYLLLGAFSSGIFAYGLSLLYGLTAATDLGGIRQALTQQVQQSANHVNPVAVIALLTTATGLFFKIAAIPFHQWLPDAYEGAPTSVTGFHVGRGEGGGLGDAVAHLSVGLVSVANGVRAAADLRFDPDHDGRESGRTHPEQPQAVCWLTLRSRTSATCCWDWLRWLRWIILRPHFSTALKAFLLYLLVYTFMNLGAFAVVTSLRQRNVIGDEIDDIAGLFSRAPTEAVLMLIFLLSLAGIPPLAGFYGKYFIFLSLMESGHYVLASLAVLYAVFGLYYYMRIANAMFMSEALDKTRLPISVAMRVALGITAFATVVHRHLPREIHSRRDLVDGPGLAQMVKRAIVIYASRSTITPPREKEHVGTTGKLQPVGIYFSRRDGCRMADRCGTGSLAAYDVAVSWLG